MDSTMMARWQQRCMRPSHGYSGHWRAGYISRTTSSATDPPPSPQLAREITAASHRHGFARWCRTGLREEVVETEAMPAAKRAEGAVPSISCSQLDQPPLPLRCPRCGWLTAARSEPARCRVKCRAIDTSSDRPRAEERSRAGRPAAGGRHRVRSGAARWPERPAWAAPGDRLRFGGADRSPGVGL